MEIRIRKFCSFVFVLFSLIFFAENIAAYQRQTADAAQLRRAFVEAVGQKFEIVKDELKRRPRDTASDYWLVYVKPQRSGVYSLKYSYNFIKKWSELSSEEGENEFRISVGGKNCHRRNNPERGISNFCLGDTIILPILTANLKDHAFSLKFDEQKTESVAEAQKYLKSVEKYDAVEDLPNELKSNIKLLGTRRSEMPHRACCAVTVEYYAIFEAVKPGRFNLGLSSSENNESLAATAEMDVRDATPIIIVAPETPITALIPSESTIHYADKRRFSSHAGNSFITNLLILQPGDVFALRYARRTLNYDLKTKLSERPKITDLKPSVQKLPFMIKKEWSFNEWITDSLPKN